MRREENAVWVTIACADKILDLIVEKGSICIDGISLTVAAVTKRNFSVSVIPHTGEETTLLKKKAGDAVNLERAMAANGRFGGHIVSGHIDGTGIVKSLKNEGNAVWVEISASEEIPVRTGEKCLTMKMPRETQRETQGSAWSFFRNMDFKVERKTFNKGLWKGRKI